MRNVIRLRGLLWLLLLGAGVPLSGSAPSAPGEWHVVRCGDSTYHYVLYVPLQGAPAPAIVLLHGAGGEPVSMVEAWKDLARQDGIVLLAPDIPQTIAFEALAPQVFHCMVEDARRGAKIDPRRVYLFGHSMGGYLAYDAALLESRYFAAAAIHAMGIAEEYTGLIARAARKMPIAIYIGDRDQLIPLAGVRRTRDLLLAAGFTVHYVELPGHNHNYFAISDQIDADAWGFLKDKVLPGS
ncbi:MAG: alpha/beta fold hydrolase [Gemmatimonadales bacterium]